MISTIDMKAHAVLALAECGHDVSFTAGSAVEKFIDSIPSFMPQDKIFHDLNHIFANAVYGTMEEEDPVFILQASLSGQKLSLPAHEKPEYLDLAKLLQERAEVIQAFFQTLTGIEKISSIPNNELQQIPLCMFGMVPDHDPLRDEASKFAYRLMSKAERSNVVEAFMARIEKNGLTAEFSKTALMEAPQRIHIPIASKDQPTATPIEA